MSPEDLTFAVYAIVGLIGALAFVLLYATHPMTRETWWRSKVGRNLMAYSSVMVMIYITAMLNRWFPGWPLSAAVRLMLGLAAVTVVWWRLFILVGEIHKAKREK